MSSPPLAASIQERPTIRGRWWLLTRLSALGAVAYLPALNAMGMSSQFSVRFVLGVSVACALAVWLGLRCADRAGLPMPLLRDLEAGQRMRALDARGLRWSLAGGTGFGLLAAIMLRILHIPNLPGSLATRLSTTLFAAISLEVVIHLGIMSALVAWRRSLWTGILGSALAFVIFHSGGAAAQTPVILLSAILLNGAIGVFLGWLYGRYGFECVVLGHACAHAAVCVLG